MFRAPYGQDVPLHIRPEHLERDAPEHLFSVLREIAESSPAPP